MLVLFSMSMIIFDDLIKKTISEFIIRLVATSINSDA